MFIDIVLYFDLREYEKEASVNKMCIAGKFLKSYVFYKTLHNFKIAREGA